jgi:uncharacterized protein (DUF302 family)
MGQSYAITRELPGLGYDQAVARVTTALAAEGFGILTEIDVQATLKKKLDVDFRRYVILGACNPLLAHRALTVEPLLGVLLPCNVVVMEREGGGVTVAAFSPTTGFELVGRPEIQPIAVEVEGRLERVLAALS